MQLGKNYQKSHIQMKQKRIILCSWKLKKLKHVHEQYQYLNAKTKTHRRRKKGKRKEKEEDDEWRKRYYYYDDNKQNSRKYFMTIKAEQIKIQSKLSNQNQIKKTAPKTQLINNNHPTKNKMVNQRPNHYSLFPIISPCQINQRFIAMSALGSRKLIGKQSLTSYGKKRKKARKSERGECIASRFWSATISNCSRCFRSSASCYMNRKQPHAIQMAQRAIERFSQHEPANEPAILLRLAALVSNQPSWIHIESVHLSLHASQVTACFTTSQNQFWKQTSATIFQI